MSRLNRQGRAADDEWLDRIGPDGLTHLKRYWWWNRASGVVGLLGMAAVLLLAYDDSLPDDTPEMWAWAVTCLCLAVCGLFGTRHACRVAKDAARRRDLTSWVRIDLRTPATFDESIRRLRAKALRERRRDTAPPWWTP